MLTTVYKQLLTRFPRNTLECPLCSSHLTGNQQILCNACYTALPWHTQNTCTSATTLISLFDYASPIKQLIFQGKTSQSLDKIHLLAQLLKQHFPPLMLEQPEAVLPVPLHTRRLKQRGFNQSVELIRPLAQALKLPLLLHEVTRIRDTGEQKKLAAVERQTNLEQAFQLIKPMHYKHVAIFDDVVTTGATCAELETLLIKHGVEKIQIWCCAQTKP